MNTSMVYWCGPKLGCRQCSHHSEVTPPSTTRQLRISPRINKEHWANPVPRKPLLTFYDNCSRCICFLVLWKKEGLAGFLLCLINSSFSPMAVGSATLTTTEPQNNTAKDIPSYMSSSGPEHEHLQHALVCLASFFPLCLHPRSHQRSSTHKATMETFGVQLRQKKKFLVCCFFFSL